jgi:hypothetical protein
MGLVENAEKENVERKTPQMKFFCSVNISVEGWVGVSTCPHYHPHTHTLNKLSNYVKNQASKWADRPSPVQKIFLSGRSARSLPLIFIPIYMDVACDWKNLLHIK